MLADVLVIDAVAHAYDFAEDNRVETCSREAYHAFTAWLHGFAHVPLESTLPGYQLSLEEFSTPWTAEEVASVFFEESDVDLVAYHGVEIAAVFKRGPSPWRVGVELKRAYPDRVLLYAPADPLAGAAGLEEMERKAAECPIDGFKFYPSDGTVDRARGATVAVFYDDPEAAFPFFEKARELGVRHVAVHKAMPVGPGSFDKDRVEDVSAAAVAFPDFTFEVVHSGWAFLEECALQLMLHANVYANLECVVNWVLHQPLRFAHVIGTFLLYGGPDRILFGTGATLAHPQPIVEAFAAFEMPSELRDGYGYPEVTPSVKRKVLGENMARLHGIDVAERKRALADDEWSVRRSSHVREGAPPWRLHREHVTRAA